METNVRVLSQRLPEPPAYLNTHSGDCSSVILRLMGATVLYRPVGQRELELIAQTNFRGFPSRLPEQPYFYPVTNEEYATQIARDWNTKDAASGFVGHVLRFAVDSEFLSKYPVRTVGNWVHKEYWIPAVDLDDFNAHIRGAIEKIVSFPEPVRDQE